MFKQKNEQIKKMLLPSNKIIKSRIKINARNFENKNKKQNRSMNHERKVFLSESCFLD